MISCLMVTQADQLEQIKWAVNDFIYKQKSLHKAGF